METLGFTSQKPIKRAYQRNDAAVQDWVKNKFPAINKQVKTKMQTFSEEMKPAFEMTNQKAEVITDRALAAGREALNFHFEAMAEDNEPIPMESSNAALSELLTEAESVAISAGRPSSRRSFPIRINLSRPRYVLDQIDQYAARHNRTRSALLAESALEYIRTH